MRRTDLYRVDDVRVPSVTEAMGICGLTDMSGIPLDILEHARLRGQEVHEWTDLLDSGDLSPDDVPDDSIAGYVAAYLRFKDEAGLEVAHSEFVVVDHVNKVAGTLDLAAYRRKLKQPDRLFVIDKKCVAQVSPATRIQCAGYSAAFQDMGTRTGLPAGHGRASLQLRGDGTYRLKEYDSDLDYADWFGVVRTAHFKLRHELVPPLEE